MMRAVMAGWVLVACMWATTSFAEDGIALFMRGDRVGAVAVLDAELEAARAGKNREQLWMALMRSAWLRDETGRPKEAIQLSNEALGVAAELQNDVMLGRSLCWLGWAHASIGLYEAAIQFYSEAIDMSFADGRVRIPQVWGLASQELGALYFKMGDTKQAKALLESTTAFARKYGVSVGIAEGAAHLSEIALYEGRVADAYSLADEAVRAASDSTCSLFNLARAMMIAAKVTQRRFQDGEVSREVALAKINEAIAFSESRGISVVLGELKIMKSKVLPVNDYEARYALLLSALETLTESDSELRGVVMGDVGEVLLETDSIDHAEFYLKKGLKVNQKMLRRVDRGRMLQSIAQLEHLRGDEKARLEKLQRSADAALSSGDQQVALQASLELAEGLDAAGYGRMAQQWYQVFLKVIAEAIEKEKRPDALQALVDKRLRVLERSSGLAAALAVPAASSPIG